MRFVVVAKAVPVQESLRVDALHSTIHRSDIEQRINPFDARAIQVALDLRRPGETIVGLSMGPGSAEPALREMLAAGADRAVHLVDPALAGSDSLVTARVLATAVAEVGADLVLAGARSTDSETGQLPAELAARLRCPIVSHARSIRRAEPPETWEIVVDGRVGWARVELRPPFVVSVGEKIAKPPKPTEADRGRAAAAPIERWGLARLGLAAAQVGWAGSPTQVTGLFVDAPTRVPVLFREGTVADRVRAAVGRIPRERPGARLAMPRRGSADPPPPPGPIWVLVTDSEGGFDREALPLLAEIGRAWPTSAPRAVAVGDGFSREDRIAVSGAGADSMIRVPARSGSLDSRSVAEALRAVGRSLGDVAAGLILSDPFGREVAGYLAASAELGLVGDATEFSSGPNGSIVWRKPAFAGGYLADIGCGTRPALATVRPGVFAPPVNRGAREPVPETILDVPLPDASVRTLERGGEGDLWYGDLDRARWLVTVGMGIGGPEGIRRLRPVLERWGAALGATRRVVDAGWLPVTRQVGLTGRSVAPELALLLGVGKAQNHVIGLRRAGTLLAVNPDPEAPVFRHVDLGVVAGWEEALPELEAALSRSFPDRPASRP
jgi:electron transfer flavoprotein alpha subunit